MGKADLTAQRLRELLHYDSTTGVFVWLHGQRNGKIGGTLNKPIGYSQISIGKVKYYAHRLAWLYVYGKWPEGEIDHINGNRLDNRIANLRDVERTLNMQNRRRAVVGSRSGLLGVVPMGKRWYSRIRSRGVLFNLGSFKTAEEAHQAYLEAKRRLHLTCTI